MEVDNPSRNAASSVYKRKKSYLRARAKQNEAKKRTLLKIYGKEKYSQIALFIKQYYQKRKEALSKIEKKEKADGKGKKKGAKKLVSYILCTAFIWLQAACNSINLFGVHHHCKLVHQNAILDALHDNFPTSQCSLFCIM